MPHYLSGHTNVAKFVLKEQVTINPFLPVSVAGCQLQFRIFWIVCVFISRKLKNSKTKNDLNILYFCFFIKVA